MNRRILLIVGFIIVVISVGLLLFIVFFKSTPGTNLNANRNGNTNAVVPNLNGNVNRANGNRNTVLPNVNSVNVNGNIINVSPTANGGNTLAKTLVGANAFGTTVDAQGNLLYYNKSTGQFYKLDANGNLVPLSSQAFPDVQSVTWAPSKAQAIMTFPDGSNLFYDFTTKKQATLPKEGQDFSFSPTGSQIAFKFMGSTSDNRYLVVANPDGTSMTSVEPLGDNGRMVQVAWSPNDQVIATYTPGQDATTQQVNFVGKNGENFKSAATDGRGFEGQWSPNGQQLLYSTYSADSNFNPVLHIMDGQGDSIGNNNRSLALQTWSSKCTFTKDGATLYCAVPNSQDMPTGSGIYPDQAAKVPDNFYTIDLKTGVETVLANPVGSDGSMQFSAQNVTLSPDGTYLYFTDSISGRVLQLRIH